MKYYDEKIECMPPEELKKLQLKRLKETVSLSYNNVKYYKKKMDDAGVTPDDINTLEDIVKLPFTTKDDLRDNYPFDTFAKPMNEIVRVHASSGTTGKPTVVGYTKEDIEMWSQLVARSLVSAGCDENSVVQVSYGYGLFTGGLGLHYGGERLGATVIPMSGGNTAKQLMIMKDFGTTIIACTPSYALYLAEAIEASEYDRSEFKLKYGILGAEPWSEELRQEIERKLQIKAIDIYGLSEVIGPGVSTECLEQAGLHIAEDHFLAEILDPETLKPIDRESTGELVFTSLTKQGIPVIRYRTKDITSLNESKCKCGRTHARMNKIIGRTDDMLIIRGVNVFPSQVESVLVDIAGIEPHYQLVVDRIGTLDTIEVLVEISANLFSDEVKELEKLQRKVKDSIQSTLGISVTVKLVGPKTIARSEGKAKRVIDNRKK